MNGDWPEAERRAEEGLNLSDELGEPNLGAWARLARGRTVIAVGDHERARALFREAEALGMKEDNVETVGVARFNLGYDSLSGGDYEQARHWFQAALDVLLVPRRRLLGRAHTCRPRLGHASPQVAPRKR